MSHTHTYTQTQSHCQSCQRQPTCPHSRSWQQGHGPIQAAVCITLHTARGPGAQCRRGLGKHLRSAQPSAASVSGAQLLNTVRPQNSAHRIAEVARAKRARAAARRFVPDWPGAFM
eukprot:1147416-Pelagomonas_calceolata.AAC.5